MQVLKFWILFWFWYPMECNKKGNFLSCQFLGKKRSNNQSTLVYTGLYSLLALSLCFKIHLQRTGLHFAKSGSQHPMCKISLTKLYSKFMADSQCYELVWKMASINASHAQSLQCTAASTHILSRTCMHKLIQWSVKWKWKKYTKIDSYRVWAFWLVAKLTSIKIEALS